MRRFLPELIALPLLPLLLAQGRYTRHVTPRLPEAAGPAHGTAGAAYEGQALSLLALGESPVAGVGVERHEQAVTGQLAHALAQRLQRPVAWRAYGRNGSTVRQALEHLLPQLPTGPVDLALVAFGVNDTTDFRSVARWRAGLGDLLAALEARCQPRLILLSGVPPMVHFPALPQPLRWTMGQKARALDGAVRELAQQRAHIRYVALELDYRDRTLMASDGFHPSALGCAAWARELTEAALRCDDQP